MSPPISNISVLTDAPATIGPFLVTESPAQSSVPMTGALPGNRGGSRSLPRTRHLANCQPTKLIVRDSEDDVRDRASRIRLRRA